MKTFCVRRYKERKRGHKSERADEDKCPGNEDAFSDERKRHLSAKERTRTRARGTKREGKLDDHEGDRCVCVFVWGCA